MERTRKQNLKIYFKYKHIYYTCCVKYAIFTCLTTVQIFRKAPGNISNAKPSTKTCDNKQWLYKDHSYYTVLRDTTDSVTIKMIINQWASDTSVVCSGGEFVDRGYVTMHCSDLLSTVFGAAFSGFVSSLAQRDRSAWLRKQGEEEGSAGVCQSGGGWGVCMCAGCESLWL